MLRAGDLHFHASHYLRLGWKESLSREPTVGPKDRGVIDILLLCLLAPQKHQHLRMSSMCPLLEEYEMFAGVFIVFYRTSLLGCNPTSGCRILLSHV